MTLYLEYKGYCLPEESVLLIAKQAQSRDPEAYPEPTRYIPARGLS